VFRFTYIRNPGAAFGMLSEHRWIFILLSAVAIVGVIVFVVLKKPKDKLLTVSLGLVLGGGIGNMIDRIFLGDVTDFLDFYLIPVWKWIFNVADACACVGAGLLMLYLIADTVRSEKEERAKKAQQSGEGENHE
ncbi:MAG: signal peptidase II, partial [Clostridia bacterium]|nr:signal peptidase II [Clostridia bacterium]